MWSVFELGNQLNKLHNHLTPKQAFHYWVACVPSTSLEIYQKIRPPHMVPSLGAKKVGKGSRYHPPPHSLRVIGKHY